MWLPRVHKDHGERVAVPCSSSPCRVLPPDGNTPLPFWVLITQSLAFLSRNQTSAVYTLHSCLTGSYCQCMKFLPLYSPANLGCICSTLEHICRLWLLASHLHLVGSALDGSCACSRELLSRYTTSTMISPNGPSVKVLTLSAATILTCMLLLPFCLSLASWGCQLSP